MRITIEDPQRGFSRSTNTDANGLWRIGQLPVGTYRVSAAKDSFATQTADEVRVEVDSFRRLDFTLQLGGFSQTLNIRESLLQTEASETGTLIEQQRIVKLPLNRRGFL